jgi:flagellar protein FlgJ
MTILATTSAMAALSHPSPADPGATRLQHAAQEFEAIFIRQMLATLDRTARISGSDRRATTSLYGTMVVDVMADAVAAAGGLGLGETLVREFEAGRSGGSSPTLPEVKR